MHTAIGQSVNRKEAWDKVTGRARYTDDLPEKNMLFARLLTSPHAHARILRIDTSKAEALKGVEAVITGTDCSLLFGVLLRDRPALAMNKVRYAGEPVAMVVANDEATAQLAVRMIQVDYEPLSFITTPSQSLSLGAPLVHDQAGAYQKMVEDVYPEAYTNVASRYRMKKGDAQAALTCCDIIVEQRFYLPPSDHLAMEVRTARAQISAEGTVTITTASQAPYAVRKQIAEAFNIPAGQIRVQVPFVGGGFGGKVPVFWRYWPISQAYMSMAAPCALLYRGNRTWRPRPGASASRRISGSAPPATGCCRPAS